MSKSDKNENISSFQKRSFITTIIFIAVVVLLMFIYVTNVINITKEQSYEKLSASTEEVMDKIEENLRNDRVNLRLLSKMIAQEDSLNSINVNTYLSTYDINNLIANVSVLTPENKVIQRKGNILNADGIIDYSKEVLKGEHISGLQPSLTDSSSMVIRSYMPIRKDGKTIGLLFSEMNPENAGEAWKPSIYDNSANFCIVERASGNIIINAWDSNITNVFQIEFEGIAENLANGRTGFMTMQNPVSEQITYISFMPMVIEDWEIFLTISEKDVFAGVTDTLISLNKMIICEIALLIIYFLFILGNMKKSLEATEESANIDALTGLPNRNRYEKFCRLIGNKTNELSCIYIDANGLHEINNTRGHLAGDQMLRFIADTLKVEFGENNVYRIGGDEFVVFQKKKLKIELELILQRVHGEIGRNNYHISSGLGFGGEEISV